MLPLGAPPQVIKTLSTQLGINKPIFTQFLRFVVNLIHGNLGTSFQSGQPVLSLVLHAFPATLGLAAAAMTVACIVAVPLGVLAAARSGQLFDRAILVLALLLQSIPSFGLGVLLVYFLAVQHQWFPAVGLQGWTSFVLPTVTLSAGLIAILIRTVRQGMIGQLSQDYVRTARAKGLPEWKVLLVHALRNAALPLVTILGLQAGFVLGGAFVVELIFNWPGVGLLAIQAIQNRDFPVIQGVVMLTATAYVSINLIVDLAYGVLNPRIRLGVSET